MESLQNNKKRPTKLASKKKKQLHNMEKPHNEPVLSKATDTEGKLRQSFQADDQMLWGETIDRCIQSARIKIGLIHNVHTIITTVDAL